MANQIKELEDSLKGTYADGDIHFDEQKRVLRVSGLFTTWALSSVALLAAGLLGGIVAVIAFFVGASTVALIALGVLVLGIGGFAASFARPGFVLDFSRQEILYKRHRIPFAQVRQENFVLRPGSEYLVLDFVGPGFTKRIATFDKGIDAPAARRFLELLWRLFQAPDMVSVGTYGSDLTPVQWWICGCYITFATYGGLPVGKFERFGATIRATWQHTMKRDWDIATPDDMVKTIDWLVQSGHRASVDPATGSRIVLWDIGRALWMFQIGYGFGWFEEDYCWDRMLLLAQAVQRHYPGWIEANNGYVEGRRIWAQSVGGPHQERVEQIAEKLRSDPKCPWNFLDWNMPLHRDW